MSIWSITSLSLMKKMQKINNYRIPHNINLGKKDMERITNLYVLITYVIHKYLLVNCTFKQKMKKVSFDVFVSLFLLSCTNSLN